MARTTAVGAPCVLVGFAFARFGGPWALIE
jgi:hypothetical protein